LLVLQLVIVGKQQVLLQRASQTLSALLLCVLLPQVRHLHNLLVGLLLLLFSCAPQARLFLLLMLLPAPLLLLQLLLFWGSPS